jgi:hypothetical protein
MLAGQLDSGAIYARDIPKLALALHDVLAAYERHPAVRDRAAGSRDSQR